MPKIKLEELKWSEFLLKDILDIRSANSSIDKNKLSGKKGDIPYLTRSESDNGYDSFVDKQSKYNLDPGNVITVGLDTQTAFYQPIPFYAGQNIQVLSGENLNRYSAMFMVTRLRDLMKKFNWGGNGATLTRLRHSKILLPATSSGEPDWQSMTDYMKEFEEKTIARYEAYLQEIQH